MFKCDNCGKQTKEGEKSNKVIVPRVKEYSHFKLEYDYKTRKKYREWFTTEGYEASAEYNFCDECFEGHEEGVLDGDESRIGKANQDVKRRGSQVERRSKNTKDRYKRVQRDGLRSELRG